MSDKKSSSGPIRTTMGVGKFPSKGTSKDQAKGPRKLAKGEVSNEVSRPPKR